MQNIQLSVKLSAYTKGMQFKDAPSDNFIYGRKDNEWIPIHNIHDITVPDGKSIMINTENNQIEAWGLSLENSKEVITGKDILDTFNFLSSSNKAVEEQVRQNSADIDEIKRDFASKEYIDQVIDDKINAIITTPV